ncbi:zinc-ribbon domain-containing protein [Candidatus Woesearchaeota archaeon]|nr:zinc-ribbon domain-containing protein [Candidatus Woesearchaeota archaeon]
MDDQPVLKCSRCGAKITPDDVVCPKCGADI